MQHLGCRFIPLALRAARLERQYCLVIEAAETAGRAAEQVAAQVVGTAVQHIAAAADPGQPYEKAALPADRQAQSQPVGAGIVAVAFDTAELAD